MNEIEMERKTKITNETCLKVQNKNNSNWSFLTFIGHYFKDEIDKTNEKNLSFIFKERKKSFCKINNHFLRRTCMQTII